MKLKITILSKIIRKAKQNSGGGGGGEDKTTFASLILRLCGYVKCLVYAHFQILNILNLGNTKILINTLT